MKYTTFITLITILLMPLTTNAGWYVTAQATGCTPISTLNARTPQEIIANIRSEGHEVKVLKVNEDTFNGVKKEDIYAFALVPVIIILTNGKENCETYIKNEKKK